MSIWVVVSDSAQAKIMAAEKPGSALAEVAVLEHPEGRMHEQKLTTDLPGRAFDSGGQGRHAMGKQVNPKQQESIRFAKHVADYLESGRNANSFNKFYVIAPPAFLGQLKGHFPTALSGCLAGSIDRNLVGQSAEVIRSHLPELL